MSLLKEETLFCSSQNLVWAFFPTDFQRWPGPWTPIYFLWTMPIHSFFDFFKTAQRWGKILLRRIAPVGRGAQKRKGGKHAQRLHALWLSGEQWMGVGRGAGPPSMALGCGSEIQIGKGMEIYFFWDLCETFMREWADLKITPPPHGFGCAMRARNHVG